MGFCKTSFAKIEYYTYSNSKINIFTSNYPTHYKDESSKTYIYHCWIFYFTASLVWAIGRDPFLGLIFVVDTLPSIVFKVNFVLLFIFFKLKVASIITSIHRHSNSSMLYMPMTLYPKMVAWLSKSWNSHGELFMAHHYFFHSERSVRNWVIVCIHICTYV